MANWWDADPIAQPSQPSQDGGGNWWESDPVAGDGASVTPSGGLRVAIPARHPQPQEKAAEAPAQGQPDGWGAFGTGIKQGATLGFSDELGALSEASGLPETRGPFSLIARPAIGLVRSSLTDQGAKDYEEALARRREEIRLAEENSPGAFLTGNVVGGLATAPFMPGAAVAKGATVLGRAGNAALTGAGYGAAYGVGTGEDAQGRVEGGLGGALIGGLTGGVASPVVDGLAAGGRALAAPVINTLRAVRNPDDEAARRIGIAIQRDGRTPEQAARTLEAENASGVPMIVADTGGETTRALARSSANTSPEARQALSGATDDRFQSQSERVGSFVESLTGGNRDTAGTVEDLQRAASQVNRPAYARAYREGQAVWTPGLEQLLQAPAVQDAVRQTMRTGGNRAAAQGFQPVRQAFEEVDGRLTLRTNPDGSRAIPNLQFWDQVKRNLDDMVTAGQREGRGNAAGDVRDLRNMLRDELDRAVPSYADARRGAAAFFGAEDALDAGAKFVTAPMENAEARRIVGRMSQAEKELFRRGFANSLLERLSGVGDTRNITNAMFLNNPRARERIEIALGPREARQLEVILRAENIMNQTRQAVSGNSTTARQLAELGLAGGRAGAEVGVGAGAWALATGDYSAGNLGAGATIAAALRYGRGRIDQKMAQRVGEMLASNDPKVIRRAAQMLASRPGMTDALRRGEEYILKALAPQVGSPLPIGQALHAEDEQAQGSR